MNTDIFVLKNDVFQQNSLNHHFFIEQFDYYTAFFGKLGKEIILFYKIMQFAYDFTSLATHSTCTVLGKRSTAVNFSTL